MRQGARRVVGLDSNNGFLERARKRFPTVEFRHSSWWNIPDEKFDVILFLSAIHYEPEQRALLQKLAGHLTPSGVLVLECGVAGGRGKSWEAVMRADGVRRYPTLDAHRGALEALCGPRGGPQRAAARRSGAAPCVPLRPAAEHGAALSRAFHHRQEHAGPGLARRDVPLVSTDLLLDQIRRDKRYDWSPAAEVIRRFPAQMPGNIVRIGQAVAEECPRDFVEILMLEGPCEADLFCIEGEILIHEPVMSELLRRLRARNIRPWLFEPRQAGADEAAPAARGRRRAERIAARRSGALAIPPGRL